MTVRDLIDELKELPEDMLVVVDYKEVTRINVEDSFYILDRDMQNGYSIGSAVVLE
ncbi:MAG: hypothetical protein J6Y78_16195 [Paludibacteraceae bacterium]|nr:hypothetical protein [Paludibacteraceae bacterium]